MATRAILIGLVSLLASVLFIMVDVGSIGRMIQLPWVYQNPTSMFFYSSITYYLFGLFLLGELYYTVKLTRGKSTARDKTRAKWLSILAVVFALALLVGADGALFAVVKAREFWNNPLLPPHFAVAALATGTAIILLVAIATNLLRRKEIVAKRTLSHMGVLLAVFLVVAAFMDIFDFLVFTYSDNPTGAAVWDLIWGPQLGFSIVHIAGYAIALVLLIGFRKSTTALAVAAALAIMGLVAYRYNLVTAGFADPILPFQEVKQYWPSRYEIALTLGILALVSLAYLVLTRLLPMEEDENGTPRWNLGLFGEESRPTQPSESAAVDT
jgi:Ni/Fe-hydrogenase subunit HybB-like protein